MTVEARSNFLTRWHQHVNVMIFFFMLTLLERQMTGHIEQPRVQQQQRHPQNSHLTFTGRVLRSVALTRPIVALYSSGATRACSEGGNSPSKRFDSPNLKR